MEIQIVKAGWLQRRTSVLHRWKKNWFVLFRSGELAYFESEDSHKAEERFIVRAVVVAIRTAGECDCSPPDGFGKRCQLTLKLRQEEDLELCAETPDDMSAWQIALEEARTINQRGSNVSYSMTTQTVSHGYPGEIISSPPVIAVQQTYIDADGNQTVIANPPPQIITTEGPGWVSQQAYYHSGPAVMTNPSNGSVYLW